MDTNKTFEDLVSRGKVKSNMSELDEFREYLSEYERKTKYLRYGNFEDIAPSEKEKERLLKNLLAVIHRDGGHYVDNHGVKKATQDAIDIILDERRILEQEKLLKLMNKSITE